MLSTLLSLVLIAPGPFLPTLPVDDGEPAAVEIPEIDLASPEAAVAFEEGVIEFSRGAFTDAAKKFRSAKKGAKKNAKLTIASYEKACKEGKKLTKIETAISKSQWRKALKDLTKIERTVGEASPLEPHLKPLRESIHAELYFHLATFEEKPPGPEAKVAGRRPSNATISDEKGYSKDGKRSLRWAAGNLGGRGGAFGGMSFGALPLAAFDGNEVNDYRILDAWIYSTSEDFGKFTFYFGIEDDGPGTTLAVTDLLKIRCFFHHVTVAKKGWHHIRIDLLKDLPKHHNLEWADVTGVSLLIVPPSKGKTIYIDSIRLERP